MAFALSGLTVRYGAAVVVDGVTARLEPGCFTAIVGPNGAGKSTLMGVLAGLKSGYGGRAEYEGREIGAWSRREYAQRVSFLPQSVTIDFPFTAEQVVRMGRTPHGTGWFESGDDNEAVRAAMETIDAWEYRARDFRSLSGGERQRVLLAAALAQSPRALLLDEPATYLDLKHQMDLYALLRRLAREGLLVAAVTHDLNLAAHDAGSVLMLHRGKLAGHGAPREVITPGSLRQVFAVEAAVPPVIGYGD